MMRTTFDNLLLLACLTTMASFIVGCGARAGGVNVWRAVNEQDTDAITKYVTAGGDVDVESWGGVTPLLQAFLEEKFESYRTLLELGADPNVIADNGDALMVYAACTPDPKWLRLALKHGGDPNQFNATAPPLRRGTPLLSAIGSHSRDCAMLLIDAGADVNLLPSDVAFNESPLVSAIYTNQFDVVLALLEAGADYESKKGSVTFLHALRSRNEMTYRLKKMRADLEAVHTWLRNRGVNVNGGEQK